MNADGWLAAKTSTQFLEIDPEGADSEGRRDEALEFLDECLRGFLVAWLWQRLEFDVKRLASKSEMAAGAEEIAESLGIVSPVGVGVHPIYSGLCADCGEVPVGRCRAPGLESSDLNIALAACAHPWRLKCSQALRGAGRNTGGADPLSHRATGVGPPPSTAIWGTPSCGGCDALPSAVRRTGSSVWAGLTVRLRLLPPAATGTVYRTNGARNTGEVALYTQSAAAHNPLSFCRSPNGAEASCAIC